MLITPNIVDRVSACLNTTPPKKCYAVKYRTGEYVDTGKVLFNTKSAAICSIGYKIKEGLYWTVVHMVQDGEIDIPNGFSITRFELSYQKSIESAYAKRVSNEQYQEVRDAMFARGDIEVVEV